MELYVYDRTAGLVDVLEQTTSVRWRRRYFEPGEVEVHVPATRTNRELLAEGRILRRTDRDEAAIIEQIDISEDDLAVSGRMLSSLLERAILSTCYTLHLPPEQAMLALIPEGTRVVPELTAAQAAGVGSQDSIEMQATYKNLLTVEERLARASNLGFRVLFEPGVMTFQVYEGVDRTVQQNQRPFVLFSDEFGNLTAPRYTKTSKNYRNRAYVAGAGEGAEREVVLVDLSAGEEVRELYVDARDIQREEGTTDEEYQALLEQRGLEQLAACVKVESFEGDGEDVENFQYRVDWDLGDLVSVQYTRLGITMHERITEVEEVYENGIFTFTPTFGSPLPETLDLGDDTE